MASVITYKSQYFWCVDNYLEVLSFYLKNEFEQVSKTQTYSYCFDAILDFLDSYSKGEMSGALSFCLDRIEDTTTKRKLIEILCELKTVFHQKPHLLTRCELILLEELKHEENRLNWSERGIEVEEMIDIIDAFIALLKEELGEKNGLFIPNRA